MVSGGGTVRIDGDATGFAMAGAVLRRGLVRGSATVRGLDPVISSARLSGDGVELRVRAYGKQVAIRKDACGNRAPQATITNPPDGASMSWGRSQQFAASVSDPEDGSFPEERLRFESSRDGLLGTGRLVFTNALSPGQHLITFTATDSGGLAATDSVRITVQNRAPDVPTIIQPAPAASLVATGPVVLEGKAFDPEDGMLDGASLTWASRLGQAVMPRGSGRRVSTVFAKPGNYELRLTATDRLGRQRAVARPITVQPFSGNTPPQVAIVVPDHLSTLGEVAAVLVQGEKEFVGTANDNEDGTGALQLSWRAERLQPAGPEFEFGTDTVAVTNLPAVAGNTRYRISFSATDTGGLTTSTSIQLLILENPID